MPLSTEQFKRLLEQLELHEGVRTRAYLDTVNKWTVGVGYNLTDRGRKALEDVIGRKLHPGGFSQITVTRAEARAMLYADVAALELRIPKRWPFYVHLDPIRQRVALDMAYNMGAGALTFRNTMKAAERGDWIGVAINMMKSKWAHQVGDGEGKKWDRAERLSRMALTGEDYTK